MAIEFNCPYCTATVRVGLDAAGKFGRCPQCDTRIRIPDLRPTSAGPSPPVSVIPIPAAPTPTAPQEFPDFTKPKPPSQPTPLSEDGMPIFNIPETPVLAKYVKKKKAGNWAPMIPPILFGGLFVIIGVVFHVMTRPNFTGELIGNKLDPNQVISVSIQGSMYNIPKQPFHELVDELRQRPSAVRSNLVNLRFDAGAGDTLKVSLRPGIEADLIRVPIQDLKAVQKHYDNNYSKLNDERLHELQDALTALCNDWKNSPEDQKLKTLPDYRDKIGFNAFVKGLGRICEAIVIVDGLPARYPCVHEDGTGSLAFLVPVGTEQFMIRQRTDIGTRFFPSKFEINITVPLPNTNPEIIPDAPVDPAESVPIPLQETEKSNETPSAVPAPSSEEESQ